MRVEKVTKITCENGYSKRERDGYGMVYWVRVRR